IYVHTFMKCISLFFILSLIISKLYALPSSESGNIPWGADEGLARFHPTFPKQTTPRSVEIHTQQNEKSDRVTLLPLLETKDQPTGCASYLAMWEKSGLSYIKSEKTESEKQKLTLAQKSCRAMIRFFQIYISPIDGPRSSFYPTSSQYALEAIQKYGVFKG